MGFYCYCLYQLVVFLCARLQQCYDYWETFSNKLSQYFHEQNQTKEFFFWFYRFKIEKKKNFDHGILAKNLICFLLF